MKHTKLILQLVLLLMAVSSFGQTFTPIDIIDWSNQAGTSGTTAAQSTWDASGNEAKNCDSTGLFGPTALGFVIADWEGTCGCDCEPNDPDPKCGQNDAQLRVSIAPDQLLNHCQTKISFSISGTGDLNCGAGNSQNPEDYTPGECNTSADWAGTDFMLVQFNVLHADGNTTTIEERICGTNGLGVFEEVFDNAISVEVVFTGGTQKGGAYEISNIVAEGVLNEILGFQVFASNTNNGEICVNSSLPLILLTNATEGDQFIWSGPNNFISNEKTIVINTLTEDLSGVYSVQVTDKNGCVVEKQVSVTVLPSNNASCVKAVEFSSLNGIICSTESLPSVSDNGVRGTWSPSADLSSFAGQDLDFTFTPDDPSYETFVLPIQVDDANKLNTFAIQPDPIPVFCNGSSETFDLIDIFQMDINLSLTINGEEDIFHFVQNNQLINKVEAQMRAVSFQGITPGEKVFFIEGTNTCGANQKTFRFYVAPSVDPVVIDTMLCDGDNLEYFGYSITQDTMLTVGDCGGQVEVNITRLNNTRSRIPAYTSTPCPDVEAVYYYDSVNTSGRTIGFTTEYHGENYYQKWEEDAINEDFIFPERTANGCYRIAPVFIDFSSWRYNKIDVELCAYEDTSVTFTDLEGAEQTISVNIRRQTAEWQIGCDSLIQLNFILKETQVDSFTGVYCADEVETIEIEPGRFVQFDRNYFQDEFVTTGTANGCEGRAYVDLVFLEPTEHVIDETICPGESVIVGTSVFTEAVTGEQVVLSRQNHLGCDSVVTVNIEVINADITSDMLTCNESQVQLRATHNGTITSWSGPAGFSSTDETPSVTVPGRYTVSIEGPNGCVSDFSYTVTQDITPPEVQGFGGEITCNSNNQIVLSSTTNGTIVGWTGPNGFSSTRGTPIVRDAGTYIVTARGTNGCEASQAVEVIMNTTPPTISASGEALTCNNNQTVQIATTTDGASVSWTGPNGFSSTEVSPTVIEAGTYTITATAANGCTTIETVTIDLDIDEPTVTADDVVLDCNNNMEIPLVASTDGTITGWTGPNGFSSSEASPTITEPGEYEVTVVATNGCTNTIKLNATEDITPPSVVPNNILLNCANTSGNLLVSTDGQIVDWTGPNGFSSVEAEPTVSEPGTYTVTVRAANGCETVENLIVDLDDTLPTVATDNALIGCKETETTLQGSTDGSIVDWTGPNGFSSTEASPTVTEAGNYTLTVIGTNGCTAQSVLTVTVDNAEPTLAADDITIDCNTPSTALTATTDGNILRWEGPNGFSSTEASPSIDIPGEYTVVAAFANGCEVFTTMTVTEDKVDPEVTETPALDLNCTTSTGVLSVTTNGSVVSWSGPNSFSSTDENPVVIEAGTYEVLVMTANGCTTTAQVQVNVDDTTPTIATDNALIGCKETETTLQGSTDGSIVDWTGPNGFNSTEASPIVTEAGDYTLTVIGDNGCTAQSVLTVTVDNAEPTLATDDITIDCNTPSTALTATTDGNILRWEGPNGFSSTEASPTIDIPGEYTVVAAFANGCEVFTTMTVTEDKVDPEVTETPALDFNCTTSSGALSVTTNGSVVSWSGPNSFSSTDANPVVSEAGTYEVIVMTANGCTTTAQVQVNVDDTTPTIATDNALIGCKETETTLQGSTDGSIVDWTGPNGFSSTEASPTVTEAGDYTLTVIGDNGCTAQSVLTVTVDNAEPTLATDDITIDCNTPNATLTATTDGNILRWEGPNGFSSTEASPTIDIPGEYTVVAAFANGCEVFTTMTVTEDKVDPEVTENPALDLNCTTSTGALSVTTNGSVVSWSGPNSFSSTDANPVVSEAGTYEVLVMTANGCTTTAQVQVNVDDTTPTIATDNALIGCKETETTLQGSTDGSIVDWTGPNGFSSTEASPTVTEAGDYTLTVIGDNGCTAQSVLTVTVDNAEPTLATDDITIDCNTPSTALTATTDGNILRWEGPNGFSSTETSPTIDIPGEYTVVAAFANGCEVFTTMTVTEDKVDPEVTETPVLDLNCTTSTGALSVVSNGTVVSWSGPNSFSSTDANPVVSEAGTYEVLVMTANGCTTTAQVQVNVDDTTPSLATDDATLDCNNPTLSLSASTDGTIIEWTGPNGFTSNTAAPSVSEAGEYTVTAEGANGCTVQATLTVSADTDMPDVSVSDMVVNCNTPEVALQASTTATIVGWEGPGGFSSNEDAPMVSAPGAYTVTVESDNGCQTTGIINITEDLVAPDVMSFGGEITCEPNSSVRLDFSTSGTFVRWEGPEGFTSEETNPEVQVQGEYRVVVMGPNGCENSTTTSVTGSTDIPDATASVSDVLTCDRIEVRLTASSTASIVEWTAPDGSTISDASPLVNVPGTYTVMVESNSGCQGFATILVEEDVAPPSIELSAGDLDCINTQARITATTTGNIRGWRGPNGFTSLEDSPSVSLAGEYEVEVEAANGCIEVQTIEVVENVVLPQVELAFDGAVSCASSGATLQVTTDGQVTGWSGPEGFSGTSATEQVFSPGEYTVTVEGANGCSTTENITVAFTELEATVGKVIGSCVGVANGSFELELTGATPPFTLSGIGADRQVNSLTEVIDALTAGSYDLTITDANGCTTAASVDITDDRSESVSVDVDVIDPLGEYDLDVVFSGDVDRIEWDNSKPGLSCYDCASPSVTITEDTRYEVTVFDSEGCSATTSVLLSLNSIKKIYVPNIIRRSSTVNNNLFYPQGIKNENAEYTMNIFDRWGNVVYTVNNGTVNDPTHAWEGKYNGSPLNSGVYVYHIVVTNEFGDKKVMKGDVTLMD